jgi:hypothetical protein
VNRRSGPWIIRILFALVLTVAAGGPHAAHAALDFRDSVGSPVPTTAPLTEPTTAGPGDDIEIDEANPFLPENRDLTDCVGMLQRPGCGSEARGGWHQNAVAIVMVTGLLIIFGRVAWGVRRSQKNAATTSPD